MDWTSADWVALLGAVGVLVTIVAGHLLTWRRLEVIRKDVNSSKAALEHSLEGSLSENVDTRKAEALRTGDPADLRAADRAVGALEQAASQAAKPPADPPKSA